MIRRLFAIAALLFSIAVINAPATAQTNGIPNRQEVEKAIFGGEIPPGDVVQQWIAAMFNIKPGAGPQPVSDSVSGDINQTAFTTSLPRVIGIFNIVCGVFAMIAIFYHVSVYMIDVGRDGKLDGPGMDPIWSPMRMMMGIAFLLPVPGGPGWSAAQYASRYAAYYGIMGGNYIWQRAADFAFMQNEALTPIPSLTTSVFVGDVLYSNICMSYFNQRAYEANKNPDDMPIRLTENLTGTKAIYRYSASARLASRATSLPNAFHCGSVTIEGNKSPNGDQNRGAFKAARDYLTNKAWIPGYTNEGYAAFKAHSDAYKALTQEAYATTQRIVALMRSREPQTQTLQDQINDIVEKFVIDQSAKYDQSVLAVAQAVARSGETSTSAMERIRQAGWTNAGAFYLSYAIQASAMSSITSKMPNYEEPNVSIQGFGGPQRKEILAELPPVLEATRNAIDNATHKSFQTGNKPGYLIDIVRQISDAGYSGGTLSAAPLRNLVLMGHNYMTVGGVLIAAKAAIDTIGGDKLLGAAGNVLGGIPGAGKFAALGTVLAGGLYGFIGWIGPFFLFLGAFLAYAMPLFPAVMWYGAVLGFLALMFEAIIASSLWSIAHMQPGDRGMVGSAMYGYSANINLLIRPMLMTLGMICGVAMYSIMSGVISNGIWSYAVPALGIDSFAPIGLIVVMIVVMTFQLALAYTSFNMIFTIPDNVPRWLGLDAFGHTNPGQAMQQMQGIMTLGGMQNVSGAAQNAFATGAAAGREAARDKMIQKVVRNDADHVVNPTNGSPSTSQADRDFQ